MFDFDFDQMRLLVLSSIANGNAPGQTSHFLHATASLKICTHIHRERQDLYSNWLVRWPASQVDCSNVLDFTKHGVRQKFFTEQDDDSKLIKQYCDLAFRYTSKDSEILYLARPPLEAIEWWDEEGNEWVPALNAAKSQVWMRKLTADTCSVNVFSSQGDRLQAASKVAEASYWGKA